MAEVHTNDIGVAIQDALALIDSDIEILDWSKPNEDPAPTGDFALFIVDSSEGFSNLIIEADNCRFRVSITRIG